MHPSSCSHGRVSLNEWFASIISFLVSDPSSDDELSDHDDIPLLYFYFIVKVVDQITLYQWIYVSSITT